MNHNQVAHKVWKDMANNGWGAETSLNLIEKAIKEAVEKEREEISQKIKASTWSFERVPWSMWFTSLWFLFFMPKKFYGYYFKCIQLRLAHMIEERKHK